jgi:hypothetical protein
LQTCWEQQGEEGAIILSVMLDGATPSDIDAWVGRYGSTNPMVADPTSSLAAGLNGGYPTYPVIGPDMVIQNIDLFPFSCAGLEGYL